MVLRALGDERIDEWAWLRQRDDPAVLPHLRAENDYTARRTAHLSGFTEELFQEIRSRIVETDLSVATRLGPWWYFGRTTEGLDYPAHCRAPVDSEHRPLGVPPGAEGNEGPWPDEQVLLDENDLARGSNYLAVGDAEVSPGHQLLAYNVDLTGDERYTLYVRNLETGEDLPESVEGTSYGVAWADDETLFYTRPDDANRAYQVWRHDIRLPAQGDTLVYEDPDEHFHVGVGRTKDGTHVVIESHSKLSSEAHVVACATPLAHPRVIEPRRQGVEYSVDHQGCHFLILTNEDADNFRLMSAPDDRPGRAQWTEVVAHRPDVRLLGTDVFRRHLALYERADGCMRIRTYALDDPDMWSGPLPAGTVVPGDEFPSTFIGGANAEFDSSTLRYDYTSLVTPRSVFDFDMDEGSAVLRKRQRVLGSFDAADYVTDRRWATSHDGTQVPLSLVRRSDTPLDATAPCLLYGYGAYEHSIDPMFSSVRLSLLDRGFVYAIAHVRGGGEMGRGWYEDGKLARKPNSFADYLACARHLVDEGLVDPEMMVARGASAGGLLMGASVNSEPERFRAVVAEVPFVDCLTTMLDQSLPLTVTEWEEWGNPEDDVDAYRVMKSYSPYDNVRAVRYPDMLVTAGLEDPRVGYWEPAKWVQKLRDADTANQVMLKIELEAGHGGPSGRYDAWRDEAFVLAFVLDVTGRVRLNSEER